MIFKHTSNIYSHELIDTIVGDNKLIIQFLTEFVDTLAISTKETFDDPANTATGIATGIPNPIFSLKAALKTAITTFQEEENRRETKDFLNTIENVTDDLPESLTVKFDIDDLLSTTAS